MIVKIPVPFLIIGVKDGRNYEKERLLIKVKEETNLANFIICAAYSSSDEQLYDVNRFFFWFPDLQARKGDIIRLYTKNGENNIQNGTYDGLEVRYINLYWNFPKGWTVWSENINTAIIAEISRWGFEKVIT